MFYEGFSRIARVDDKVVFEKRFDFDLVRIINAAGLTLVLHFFFLKFFYSLKLKFYIFYLLAPIVSIFLGIAVVGFFLKTRLELDLKDKFLLYDNTINKEWINLNDLESIVIIPDKYVFALKTEKYRSTVNRFEDLVMENYYFYVKFYLKNRIVNELRFTSFIEVFQLLDVLNKFFNDIRVNFSVSYGKVLRFKSFNEEFANLFGIEIEKDLQAHLLLKKAKKTSTVYLEIFLLTVAFASIVLAVAYNDFSLLITGLLIYFGFSFFSRVFKWMRFYDLEFILKDSKLLIKERDNVKEYDLDKLLFVLAVYEETDENMELLKDILKNDQELERVKEVLRTDEESISFLVLYFILENEFYSLIVLDRDKTNVKIFLDNLKTVNKFKKYGV